MKNKIAYAGGIVGTIIIGAVLLYNPTPSYEVLVSASQEIPFELPFCYRINGLNNPQFTVINDTWYKFTTELQRWNETADEFEYEADMIISFNYTDPTQFKTRRV